MARDYNDDLFKDSTMTFGEHLEELRSSLFRAVLSLVVGFAVGLYFGDWVVKRIQDPLVAALEEYYKKSAVEKYKADLETRRAAGKVILPEEEDEKLFEQLIYKARLLPSEVYVSADAVLTALRAQRPDLHMGPPKSDEKPHEAPAANAEKAAAADDAKTADAAKPAGASATADAAKPARTAEEAAAEAELTKEKMLRLVLWHTIEDDERLRVKGLNAQEAFMIWIKAAFISGIVIASPLIFFFIWTFVAAGLYPHERKYVYVFLPFSLILFLAGAALAFFFVFEPVLAFFFSFNRMLGIEPDPRISEWLSFVLLMPLAFGVSFQLPLVMLFLERIGIFDLDAYLSKWRVAVLVIAILSMVLSPGGDPYSMMFMMVPLIVLYFGGIGLCKWLPSNRSPYDAVPERELENVK